MSTVKGKILLCLSLLLILAALFILSRPAQLFASDYILGQVISIDREKGELILKVKQPVAQEKDKNSSENVDATIGPEQDNSILIIVQLTDKAGQQIFLPGSVRPGEFIRIWGSYIDSGKHGFKAVDVRGTRSWSSDRSGVRSRLERGFQGRQGTGNSKGGRRRGRN